MVLTTTMILQQHLKLNTMQIVGGRTTIQNWQMYQTTLRTSCGHAVKALVVLAHHKNKEHSSLREEHSSLLLRAYVYKKERSF